MANGETVDRILRAATVLFAERGFAETSLRTITSMADVNLAAVNYHFGSKKALMQAVFAQFMRLINLAYTQTQDHLRNFLTLQFGSTHKRFIGLLREAVPDLNPLACYWRVNFCLGASVFTLGELESINALMEKPEADYIDLDAVVEQLVPALVGMFHSAEKLKPVL